MKLDKYVKRSLASQFGLLAIMIIVAFCLLISVLMFYQNRTAMQFEKISEQVEDKVKIATDLRYSFNLAISEMRAYFAYGGEASYYETVKKQKRIVENKMEAFKEVAENEEDLLLLQESRDFYNFYFNDVLPKAKAQYDAGEIDEVTNIAVAQNASQTIRAYQNSLKAYTDRLHEKLRQIHDQLIGKFLRNQLIFVIALLILVVCIVVITRRKLMRIAVPLNQLTNTAGQIADGETVLFTDKTNRDDELGLLSKAFEKMSKSIQEKEHYLSSQNDELLAQQDELQAQQGELEEALEMMQTREMDLKRRNDLINGIANSLDKQEVLTSIVKTMCAVIVADKGIVVLRDRESQQASFGVSENGVKQFIENMHAGFIEKLKETKKPFTIKRDSDNVEKGYHTSRSYAYDLYLPVLAANGDLEAVMMFTRYANEFYDGEIKEYENLSKQIAISLDKIKLFEQSEEERLLTQDIFDTLNEGIQLVDVTGKVLQVNQKLCDMMDSRFSDFIQKEYECWIEDIVHSVENGGELKRFFDEVLRNQKMDESTFVYHQHTPVERVVQLYCEPLSRNGEKFGTVIVHRDITRDYEVDVMKSEFVSTVSHELRTPLASVLGYTELMLNKELKPERQKKYLSTIYQEATRLTSLINDFLDVQRMEAGKQTYNKKYDDLLPLINNISEMYAHNNPHHPIHLNVKSRNTMVLGDRDKISQVFTNLISNAIKYSPDGGNIDVNVYEEGSNLKISVKDEGLGIPADAIDKLFTKFYRVDNSDRRRIGGTGLGLAIVKEIMKAHNGDIFVQSELKEGSTFTVSFPLVIGGSSDYQEVEVQQNRNGKANVIIVEDDPNLANLLKTELEESNFYVKVFSEGESALEAIKAEHPNAIVLDIMLDEKGINGWDIIDELKKQDELKSIPIFISSALDEKEKGLALGANEYLVKPYQSGMLSKLILQTLLKKDWSGQILIPSEEE